MVSFNIIIVLSVQTNNYTQYSRYQQMLVFHCCYCCCYCALVVVIVVVIVILLGHGRENSHK